MKSKLLKLYPQLLFLIVTFCIFMPSSLFLGNVDEFAVGYAAIIPLLLVASAAAVVMVMGIGAVMPGKASDIYAAVIFGGALAAYVQGNFLNPDFGALNGREIQWSRFAVNGIISSIVWIVLIVVPAVMVCLKKDITQKVIKWASLFLAGVQIVTLVVLIVTTKKTVDYSYVVTKEDEFTLSSDGNVVVFMVDTLDARETEQYILNSYSEDLKDFTFFDNVIGGGAPTALGMPLMLTGYQYDTTQSLADYHKEAYEQGTLIQDMYDAGYDVKLYTLSEYLNGANQEAIANTVTGQQYRISDKWQFFKNIYKMSAFYAFPQVVKPVFWFYGDNFAACQSPKNNAIEQYEIDDSQLYEDFMDNGVNVSSDNKTFTLYHMFGAHSPYEMNENCEDVGESNTTQERQIKGVFRYITEYIDQMKAAGIYDNSTIIITSDHGDYGLCECPTVLVKMAGADNEKIVINSDAVTFKNLYATYADASVGKSDKYGKTLFEMPGSDAGSDTVRYHVSPWDITKAVYPDDSYLKERNYSVFKIQGNSKNPEVTIVTDEDEMKTINDK